LQQILCTFVKSLHVVLCDIGVVSWKVENEEKRCSLDDTLLRHGLRR
jgi:hypothetical protein